MTKKGRILKKKQIFASDSLVVERMTIRTPNGIEKSFDSGRAKRDGVAIIALDNRNNIYLIREWRPAYDTVITHIPAGGVEKDVSESARRAQARLELQQEAGLNCRKLEKIAVTLPFARINQTIHLYLATGLYKSRKPPDEGEVTEVVKVPLEKAIRMLSNKRAPTLTYALLGLLLTERMLKK